MAASSAVFGTYELADKTLSDFSNDDLLSARQSNKYLNDVIMDSKRTRETLFLQPVPIKELLLWKDIDSSLVTSNMQTADLIEPYILTLTQLAEMPDNERARIYRNDTDDKNDSDETVRVVSKLHPRLSGYCAKDWFGHVYYL